MNLLQVKEFLKGKYFFTVTGILLQWKVTAKGYDHTDGKYNLFKLLYLWLFEKLVR